MPVPSFRGKARVGQRSVRPTTVAFVFVVLLCGVLVLFESSIVSESVRRLRHGVGSLGKAQVLPSGDFVYEHMTPALISEIARRPANYSLSPMHVHLVWIGDVSKAPPSMKNYTEMGYELTVHTSAEKILEGFQPHVLRAFNLAVPNIVGYDFLKLAMLYKFGGIAADADTAPARPASEIKWPKDCDVIFGKENFIPKEQFSKPLYHTNGSRRAYPFNRPFQILNWAMAASKPRSPHIKKLLEMAMMHFLGLRDMEFDFIQDVAGSGLMTDYVALLHEQEGRNYEEVYHDGETIPVQGLCLTTGYLSGYWINHEFIGTWKD
ncbi:hypothetical protein Gpo141_00012325 [Globisporangium polare]